MLKLYLKLKIVIYKGGLIIHGDKLNRRYKDVAYYLELIRMGLLSIIKLPFLLLRLLWDTRPKFYWYRGNIEDLNTEWEKSNIKKKEAKEWAEKWLK